MSLEDAFDETFGPEGYVKMTMWKGDRVRYKGYPYRLVDIRDKYAWIWDGNKTIIVPLNHIIKY